MAETPPLRFFDNAPVHSPELPPPSEAQILTQLERILASPLFASSESLQGFLRFTVNQTLEGRGDELKEYLLGVEVFRRGAQFDPRLDSIVRVQGSKVRSKLRDYYETFGHDDPVLIELPKGAYVPVFKDRSPPKFAPTAEPAIPAPGPRRMRLTRTSRLLLAIGLASAAVALGILYAPENRAGSPSHEPNLLQLTFDSSVTTDPALSPDGKFVAYVSDRRAKIIWTCGYNQQMEVALASLHKVLPMLGNLRFLPTIVRSFSDRTSCQEGCTWSPYAEVSQGAWGRRGAGRDFLLMAAALFTGPAKMYMAACTYYRWLAEYRAV